MTTQTVTPDVTAILDGVAVPVRVDGGRASLEALSVPYANAQVVLPLTPDTLLDVLDPRDDHRVVINGRNTGHWDHPPGGYTPWVETRRNINLNPRMENSVANWTVGGGTVQTAAAGGTILNFPAAIALNVGVFYQVSAQPGIAAAGEYWVGSIDITVPAGYPALTLRLSRVTYAGVNTLTASPGADVTIGPGETKRVNTPIPPVSNPATTNGVRSILYARGTGFPAGGRLIVKNALLEKTTVLGAYFDGSTPDIELTQYSWVGTANASASIQETRTALPPPPPVWVPDAPRAFDLGLRSRAVDHKAKSVTLELASDEALLQDYAALTLDLGAFAFQSSLRGVVNYVLGKIGAALAAAPATDADVTTYSTATNYCANPSAIVDLTGWGSAGVASLVRQTAAPWTANTAQTAFRLNGTNGVTNSYIQYIWTTGIAGRRILFRARQRNGGAVANPGPNAARLQVHYSTNGGSTYIQTANLQGSLVPNGQADLSTVVDIPQNATHVLLRLFHGFSISDPVFWMDVMARDFAGDPGDVAYWDGSTPDTAVYRYDWQGTVGASTSTRSALVGDRAPESLVWNPGVTAWEFLSPLLTAPSLRLFCDELRVWRLIDPAAYTVPGYVPISPLNATEGVDTIARDDPEVFATGVVCRYVWTDANGTTQTQADSAGTPEKVATIEFARPYPGPGAAAAILARRNGTGRTQDVTGLARWDATPGMIARVSLPPALDQVGKIASVAWQLDDTALMDIGSSGLIDAVPGSWIAWDPAQKWQDVPNTVTWQSLT